MTEFMTSNNRGNPFNIEVTQHNVDRLVDLADQAVENKGTWQDVTFKMPNGSDKKFQVKFEVDGNGKKTVTTRRNSRLATMSRKPFFNAFFGRFRRSDTKAFDKAAGDVIKRYTLSRHSILNNSGLKAAHQRLFTPQQLNKTLTPFKDSDEITHVMSTSKVIDEVKQSTNSKEEIVVLLDLDSTLYTSDELNGEKAKTTVSLDGRMPNALRELKKKNNNVRIVASTKTPVEKRELVNEKLRLCGFEVSEFDIIHLNGDEAFKLNDKIVQHKNDALESMLQQFESKDGWKPKRVIFIDDNPRELTNVGSRCKKLKIKHELYQPHADNHFTGLIHTSPAEIKGNPDAIANQELTEKEIIGQATYKDKHYYHMLRG
ncbi:hypothetical protein SOPP22_16935 [Shewanella sp. OPT22]|nr:hypothetical protein SOPP22_16935 [Shewanella sp. OPT22]